MNPDIENPEEYRRFIKQSVASGEFYKDSFDWYIFRYVSPLCDRTWLFFMTFACIAISYILFIAIVASLPIIEKTPIAIKANHDFNTYAKISSLKDSEDLRTIEETVAKRLLVNYVEKREEYNFSTMTINDLNQKLRIIKNNSTSDEFQRFTSFVGSENPSSPIQDFGTDTVRKVTIRYVYFKREINKDFVSKAKTMVYEPLPSEVDIGFQLTTTKEGKEQIENLVARINFRLSKIDNNNPEKELVFKVSDYKLFIDNK